MTLLAMTCRKASRFAERAGLDRPCPCLRTTVIALMISFIVRRRVLAQPSSAAHLRAGRQPRRSLPQSDLLLSIVMLPVTNGLYGVYRLDSVVAVSYGSI